MKTKIYLTDWKFYFKLVTAILIAIALLWSLIEGCLHLIEQVDSDSNNYIWVTRKVAKDGMNTVNANSVTIDYIKNHKELFKIDYINYLLYYCSFFTNQSNILVLFSLIFLLIHHKKESQTKMTSSYFTIGVAVYITITSLIFNFLLMPEVGAGLKDWKFSDWFNNEILHTVGPIMFVLYVTLIMRHNNILTMKPFWQQKNWMYILYPVAYGIVTLIIGEIRIASNWETGMQYPYFFMQIHSSEPFPGVPIPGYAWFIICVIIIAGICLGFGVLYNYAINKTKNWKIKN